MVEGFAIVNWVAGAANIPAGYVTPGATYNNRYVKATKSTDATNFIALNVTEEVNDVIQVLVK
jgi:hypothetical protein